MDSLPLEMMEAILQVLVVEAPHDALSLCITNQRVYDLCMRDDIRTQIIDYWAGQVNKLTITALANIQKSYDFPLQTLEDVEDSEDVAFVIQYILERLPLLPEWLVLELGLL